MRGGGTPNAAITATGADTGDADQVVRTDTADASGAWSLSLPVNKGENHFTIIGKDPETARDSAPLKVIVSVPVDDTSLPDGDLGPALPEGVEDTNITGIPSAELTVTEPRRASQTKDGKVKVVGTSDAETRAVSFEWRGNLDDAKTPPRDGDAARRGRGLPGHLPAAQGSLVRLRRGLHRRRLPGRRADVPCARSMTRWCSRSRPSTARRACG